MGETERMSEKEKWAKRMRGERTEGHIGECTCCNSDIYEDCENYTDEEGNMFCTPECVFRFYGVTANI